MAKKNGRSKKFDWKKKKQELIEKARYIMMSPVRFMKFVFMITGAATWGFFFILSLMIFSFFNSLPDIESMSFKDVKTLAIKRVSKRFEDKSKGKYYKWTTSHKISRYLIYAVVMSEDGKFFEHSGVDYNAIMRSMAQNLKKKEYAAGGSTITQQVVKNIFLTHEKEYVSKA
jgi:monofunctional biosynthetic peptidoglycan transglycosylase